MKKIALNIHEELTCDQTIVVELDPLHADSADKLDNILEKIEKSNHPDCFDDYLMYLEHYGIKIFKTITAGPVTSEIECDDLYDYQPEGSEKPC